MLICSTCTNIYSNRNVAAGLIAGEFQSESESESLRYVMSQSADLLSVRQLRSFIWHSMCNPLLKICLARDCRSVQTFLHTYYTNYNDQRTRLRLLNKAFCKVSRLLFCIDKKEKSCFVWLVSFGSVWVFFLSSCVLF